MAQTTAHLVERVIPCVPTRQWVVSVPISLRYWMASSKALTAKIHTIIRTTIGQYYVNQIVKRGTDCKKAHPGVVTFVQRFGSAINLNISPPIHPPAGSVQRSQPPTAACVPLPQPGPRASHAGPLWGVHSRGAVAK